MYLSGLERIRAYIYNSHDFNIYTISTFAYMYIYIRHIYLHSIICSADFSSNNRLDQLDYFVIPKTLQPPDYRPGLSDDL